MYISDGRIIFFLFPFCVAKKINFDYSLSPMCKGLDISPFEAELKQSEEVAAIPVSWTWLRESAVSSLRAVS